MRGKEKKEVISEFRKWLLFIQNNNGR